MSLGKKLLLVVILVVPLAAVAGLWVMINSNVDAALKELTAAYAPYGTLRYGEATVNLDGSIHVEKIEIQPRGLNVALPVQAIDIATPGLKYLATRAGSDVWRRGRPDSLKITLTDLALDLNSDAGRLLDDLADFTARPEAAGIQHCGNHKQVGLTAWRDMGFNRLHVDGTLEYNMDRSRDTASLAIRARIKDLMTLGAESSMSQVQAQSPGTPWLRGHVNDLRITYKDEGYLDSLKRLCMAASQSEMTTVVEAESGETGSLFLQQFSIAPGPTLRAAYREFLAKPDTLTLDVATPPDYKIENTGLYSAIDMADSLSFTVSLNGKRADELQYGFRPPHEGPSQALLSARAAVAEMNKPRVPVRKGESPGIIDAPKFVFRDVPKNQLHKHLGKQVRFHVTGSSMREGILTGIDGGIAHVQRTRGESEMSLSIALRHVERVEVAK